jgi:hypothetical protein
VAIIIQSNSMSLNQRDNLVCTMDWLEARIAATSRFTSANLKPLRNAPGVNAFIKA